MPRIFNLLPILFLCLLVLLAATNCKELADAVEQIFAISLSPECSVLNSGKTQSFTVKELDENNTEKRTIPNSEIEWSNADSQVADSSTKGQFTASAGGNSEVTATYLGKKARALISVNPISSHHNCRPIEWYRSQMNTGSASGNNCGPTSTHMAIKWYWNSHDAIPSVETIRNRHPRSGGWWYTSDVSETLDHYNIPYATHRIGDEDDLLKYLKRGNILLLCAEMKWLTYNRHHFYDRFYTYDSGHFLIVKGYSDNGKYFIVYDPNSWNNDYYDDSTMMGRNRYYKRSELLTSIKKWWRYAFEIGAAKSLSTFDPARLPLGYAGPKDYLLQYKSSQPTGDSIQ